MYKLLEPADLNGIAPILCTDVHTGGPGINVYELTAVDDLGDLVVGSQFRFTPSGTAVGGAIQIDVDGPLMLYAADGTTLASYYDVQKGKPVTVEYRGDRFILTGAGFRTAPHATGKLQTSGPATISLTQEDGKGLLLWNPATGSFRLINFAVVTNGDLFGASNYVEGVPGQALAGDQLYAVYLHDTGSAIVLDFWRMYTGVGAEAWTPTTNEIGIYVKRSTPGGAGIDNSRTYLGVLWTGGSNVETLLAGPVIKLRCQSHLKVWRFPFDADLNRIDTGFVETAWTPQAVPRCEFVTEGITDTGHFVLHAQHYNSNAGQVGSIRLKITGTAYNGTSFSAISKPAHATTPSVNGYVSMTTSWGVALPMGQYTVQPEIKVDGGTGAFDLSMTGYVAN